VPVRDALSFLATLKNRFCIKDTVPYTVSSEEWKAVEIVPYPCQIDSDAQAWRAHLSHKSITALCTDLAEPVLELFGRKLALKREKGTNVVDHELARSDDRIISAVSYYMHTELGPFMYSLMLAMRDVVRIGIIDFGLLKTLPFVSMIGIDPFEVGKLVTVLLGQGYDHWRSCDFSSFDCTISPGASGAESTFYEKSGMPPHLKSLLAQQMEASCSSRFGIGYWKSAGRNSGDSNTAIGNTIVNGLVQRHVYRNADAIILVFSDDCLVVTKGVNAVSLPEASALMAKFGFSMRSCDTDIYGTHFLSAHFMEAIVDGQHQMVPTPLVGKCLPKMFWSESQIAVRDPDGFALTMLSAARKLFAADSVILGFLSGFQVSGTACDSAALASELPYYFHTWLETYGEHDVQPIDSLACHIKRYANAGISSDDVARDLSAMAVTNARIPDYRLPRYAFEYDNF
jgi:hypothetical protein